MASAASASLERRPERTKTVMQLAAANPRWAAAFDMAGGEATAEDGKGVGREAATNGIKRILGQELPERRLGNHLKRLAPPGTPVTFRAFVEILEDLTKYMAETPKWKEEEKEEAEEQALQERKAQRAKTLEDPDVFEILGMRKSKDISDMQSRKDQALKNASAASRFKTAGAAVLASRKVIRGVAARAGVRSITIGDGVGAFGAAAAPSKRRFDVIPGPTKKRTLSVKSAVELEKDLPQTQIRSTGAACFVLGYSPDGSQIAGGFYDGGLRIYSADSASLVHCLNLPKFMGGTYVSVSGEAADPYQARFLRQDRQLEEQTEKTLDNADKGAMMRLNQLKAVQEPAITNLRWRPARRGPGMVATVDSAGAVSLWEIPLLKGIDANKPPRCVARVNANKGSLYACAFTQSGDKLIAGGAERVLKVYDVEATIAWAATGEEDGSLCPCEVLGGGDNRRENITAHTSRIMAIYPHPENESVLFSAGMDKKILIWDMRIGSLPVGIVGGPEICGDALDVSRNGLKILAGSHRTETPLQVFELVKTIFDAPPPEEALEGGSGSKPSSSAAAAPPPPPTFVSSRRGSRASEAAQVGDGISMVHDYQWRGDEAAFEGSAFIGTRSCQVFSAAWDNDCRTIVAAGENNNLARVFTRKEEGLVSSLEVVGTCLGEEHAFWSAAISGEGRSCAFGAADGTVVICEVRG